MNFVRSANTLLQIFQKFDGLIKETSFDSSQRTESLELSTSEDGIPLRTGRYIMLESILFNYFFLKEYNKRFMNNLP